MGTAYTIYFMNSYYLGVSAGRSGDRLVDETVGHITIPLSVTALTTIAGFAALAASSIPAIRTLGLYACLGVASIVLVTMTMVPAVLRQLPPPKALRSRGMPSRWFDQALRAVSAVTLFGSIAAFATVTTIVAAVSSATA